MRDYKKELDKFWRDKSERVSIGKFLTLEYIQEEDRMGLPVYSGHVVEHDLYLGARTIDELKHKAWVMTKMVMKHYSEYGSTLNN